ncbi:MAG TPA: hypothetical protein VK249_23105, partial [Anaerolineales bacterium]|nr:hypothetical protein [Anaerolineales bacterium]
MICLIQNRELNSPGSALANWQLDILPDALQGIRHEEMGEVNGYLLSGTSAGRYLRLFPCDSLAASAQGRESLSKFSQNRFAPVKPLTLRVDVTNI